MIPNVPTPNDVNASLAQPDFRSDIEKTFSNVAVHQDNEDVAFAERMAEEYVNVSGFLVKIRTRTDHDGYDQIWDEDVDPSYNDAVLMKAWFKTEPLQEELTKWGVDTPNKATVVFANAAIHKAFGERMLRAGDLIDLPFNYSMMSIAQCRVLNVSETGRFKTRWLYLSADVESITGDVTVRKEGDK